MRSLVKNPLKNLSLGLLLALSMGLPVAQAAGLWVKLPESKEADGGLRRDALLVRYRPTGRSVLLGVYGKVKLTPRLLEHLGADPKLAPKASDFDFSRIFSTTRRRSSRGAWDAGFESWTANPTTTDFWLARESLSVMRTQEDNGDTILEVLPTALALGPIAVPDKAVSTEDPEKVKAARRKAALSQLENSWQQVLDKKYDLALVSLDNLITKMGGDLNSEELNKAMFGRALSRFHQLGCREAGPAFEELQSAGPYFEDSQYYGALCALDRADLPVAHKRFSSLLQENSERYQDASRFYLGVVAEAQEDYSGAESAYLDTVDFASDASIVALAKDKLLLLEEKKAQDRYEKKLFSVLASAGLGWDSNALSLPPSVAPSTLNLDSGSSATYMGLAYIDLKDPWLRKLGHKLSYTYLVLGFLNSDVAPTSDLQSHSFGTSVEWGDEVGYRSTLDLKYGLTYLGKLGESTQFMTSYGATWDLTKTVLNEKQTDLDHMWLHSLGLTRQMPTAEPTAANLDGTSWLITGSHRKRRPVDTKSYTVGGEWEYKAAAGTEPRYAMAGAVGTYEQPVGPDAWKLKFSQDGAVRGTFYFQSIAKRKDFLFTTTSAIAHSLSDQFEARAQLVLSKNFAAEDNAYNRYQINLMLNAFF